MLASSRGHRIPHRREKGDDVTQFKVGDRVKWHSSPNVLSVVATGNSLLIATDRDGNEVCVRIQDVKAVPNTVTATISAELGEKAKENYPHGREPSGFLADMIGQAVADSLRQQEKGPTP